MKARSGRGIMAAAAVGAVLVAASPAAAAVDKCTTAINTESVKMRTAAFKAFTKCHDAYWKDVQKPPPLAYSRAAKACERELGKLIGTRGALATSISRLVTGVPTTCTDSDLFSLGHLPSHDFGNRWAQFQAVAALQLAYEQMLGAMRQWPAILTTVGDTGACPTCERLTQPPCHEMSCRLTGSSLEVYAASFSSNVPLSGAMVLKVCDASPMLSGADDVWFVLAGGRGGGATFDALHARPVCGSGCTGGLSLTYDAWQRGRRAVIDTCAASGGEPRRLTPVPDARSSARGSHDSSVHTRVGGAHAVEPATAVSAVHPRRLKPAATSGCT